MNKEIFTPLQIREIFHLEFLRWFSRKVKSVDYAVKGGANIRFFFSNVRYSEDMDLDVRGVGVAALKETVLMILGASSFIENLRAFGIRSIVPPDIDKAKQTQTTQRFKVHILTLSGEDLFTKVEFSRRGFAGNVRVESVSVQILRSYKLAPLLAPHYDAPSAVAQKVSALASRPMLQARDIFDLFVLRTQTNQAAVGAAGIGDDVLTKARDRVFEAEFEFFRDTVVEYLSPEDQATYANAAAWEEVKFSVAQFLEGMITHA